MAMPVWCDAPSLCRSTESGSEASSPSSFQGMHVQDVLVNFTSCFSISSSRHL